MIISIGKKRADNLIFKAIYFLLSVTARGLQLDKCSSTTCLALLHTKFPLIMSKNR